jgi:succinate-semialdehyde dehydrogenase/glutarate-semialdehyde dehydrogenase
MQRNLAIYSRRGLFSTAKSGLDVIQHKHLINQAGFINGKFTRGAATSDFEVINPGTGKPLITLPSMGLAETKESIEAASKAWATWKNTTPFERSKLLRNLFTLMEGKYKDDLAAIITLEAGKPLAEAKGEMTYANSFLEFYAEEAKRAFGEVVPSPMKNRRLVTVKQPIGPAALITPWNFPSAMITRKLAPALAAGCTVVIKPANETPLSALAICAIAQEAGIPAGVINVVTVPREHVEAVGKELCNSKDIRKVSFTGSTAVGKWLMREAASTVKKVSISSFV